jgi:hypothetical protein
MIDKPVIGIVRAGPRDLTWAEGTRDQHSIRRRSANDERSGHSSIWTSGGSRTSRGIGELYEAAFKTSHFMIQIRPVASETGQYLLGVLPPS